MDDNFVIPAAEIRGIILETCRNVVAGRRYEQVGAQKWNSEIITTILNRLMGELDRQQEWRFKLLVNSTIAQAISPSQSASGTSSSSTDSNPSAPHGGGGTRGLHVANAAYWDPPYDGMFSHKYAADGERDFDVIVSVVWLSHDSSRMPPMTEQDLEGKPPHVVA